MIFDVMGALQKLFKPQRSDAKILINSIPKSGTNLLLRVFSHIEYLSDAGMGTITDLSWRMRGAPITTMVECMEEIGRFQKKEYQTAHLTYDRALSDFLREHNIVHILIVRDPRDIVVSTAFYIFREVNDNFHDYFTSLKSDRDRIIAAIKGVPGELVEGGLPLPSIADIFKGYAPWLQDERCLVVTFEDLVGPRGGGDGTKQLELVKELTRHAGICKGRKDLSDLAKEVFSDKSRTFRKGSIGGWQEWLDEELIEMLVSDKETFRAFGYEL